MSGRGSGGTRARIRALAALPGVPRLLVRDPRGQAVLVPALAVVTALLIGAIVILISGGNPLLAYAGIYEGSIGCPGTVSQGSFSPTELVCWRSTAGTLVTATPYILAGLSVAVAFKCGLFNIGAEGQLLAGSLVAAFAGYAISGIPAIVHLPLALLAGIAAGAVWGAIPGFLRAYTGAHEVIVTIMLNYVAAILTTYLLSGAMKDPAAGAIPQTPHIHPSAYLPAQTSDGEVVIHLGVLLAVAVAVGIWWLLYRTTRGFEIRTVGANSHAARYGGISVEHTIVLAMAIAGGLGGLAGAVEVTGVNHYHTPGFSVGYGFDSIAIALLARANPLAVIPSALLFGALKSGSSRMQFVSQIPVDIIQVIQALVLIFVAAPAIIRYLYRVKAARRDGLPPTPSAEIGLPEGAGEAVL
jgi:simple sugar transport system permease protein